MHVEEGQELLADRLTDRLPSRFVVGSYVGPTDAGICHYALDNHTGEVELTRAVPGVPFPAYLVVTRGGSTIYAVSETTRLPRAPFGTDPAQTDQDGSVWFLRSTEQGPAIVERQPSGGELPTHLTMHRSGRWLVASNYGCDPIAGSVSVFPIDRHGALLEMRTHVGHSGTGPDIARQSCAHVHSTEFTLSGARLVAADLGADALVVYDFDDRSGRLARAGACSTPAGWGPRYMRWSPDGRTLFVVGELACEVGAFAYDADTASLRLLARTATVTGTDRSATLPSDLHLSGDGQLLYVANRGAVNSLVVLDCTDPAELAVLGEVPTHGEWPRDFALSPDGRLAVVANQHSDSITVLGIDADGMPRELLSSTRHAAPSFVGFV
jgi:6-phosphogluconolactonase